MEEVPVATALARPVVEMVATEGVADAQVTWLVRFSVELSEKLPVAMNCCGGPDGDARAGRGHGDRLEDRRGGHREHRRAGDAAEAGGDGGSARSPGRWPGPLWRWWPPRGSPTPRSPGW